MPHDVIEDINLFRYRQAFSLSYEQLLHEPRAEIERAFAIWSLESQRAKLETERRKQ